MTTNHNVTELYRIQPICSFWEIRNFDLFLQEDNAAIWKKMVANDGAQDNSFNLTIMRTNSSLMTIQVETSEDYDAALWVSKKMSAALSISNNPSFSEVFEFDFSKFGYDNKTRVYLGEFDFSLPMTLQIVPGISLFVKTTCYQVSQRDWTPRPIESVKVPKHIHEFLKAKFTQDSISETSSVCTGIAPSEASMHTAELISNLGDWEMCSEYSDEIGYSLEDTLSEDSTSEESETDTEESETETESESESETTSESEEETAEESESEEETSEDSTSESETESEVSEKEQISVLDKLSSDLQALELEYSRLMDSQEYYKAVNTRQNINSTLKAINSEKAAIVRSKAIDMPLKYE